MDQTVISLKDVSKAYKIYTHPRNRLLEALFRGHRKYHRDFWALRNVTVRVKKGSTVGIIGMNGSGKSTLLQVVAGIVEATSGDIDIDGRIASLLELGAGFNPEFTGRENILMNGAIMGYSREEMLERLPSIEAFAEIGDFIDQPVKTYSSGMLVRIGFAAAIHVDPDIFIVDEALAVGDAFFQHRCIRRIKHFQDQGKTVLFVSHDLGAVKSICSEALFLHAGEVKAFGDPSEVANHYHAHIAGMEGRLAESAPSTPTFRIDNRPVVFRAGSVLERRPELLRQGTGKARVQNVELLDSQHRPLAAVNFNQEVILRVHVEFFENVPSCVVGYVVRDKNGIDITGTNTQEEHVPIPPRNAGETFVVDFKQQLPLRPGSYSITTALASKRDPATYLDWLDNSLVFEVLPPPSGKMIYSTVWLPVEITVHLQEP
jgi:lipopolysaccharide transport system ATP-binding protein